MKKIALVLVVGMGFVTLAEAASAPQRERATVECLMGKAAARLNEQLDRRVTAQVATDAAMTYAAKRCKGKLSEGVDDYVYHSIRDMASRWFEE